MTVTLLSALLFASLSCSIACADGGQVRVKQQHGDYQLTVFTSPTPLRAGPIDVSVLVQYAGTGEVITDASTIVELQSANSDHPPIRAAATTAAATNKLLKAALVELPAAGRWDVLVRCDVSESSTSGEKAAEVRFAMDAAAPLPRWLSIWPWFAWPILAVLLFVVHRRLVAKHLEGATAKSSTAMRFAAFDRAN